MIFGIVNLAYEHWKYDAWVLRNKDWGIMHEGSCIS